MLLKRLSRLARGLTDKIISFVILSLSFGFGFVAVLVFNGEFCIYW
jgi:hypothetical protein